MPLVSIDVESGLCLLLESAAQRLGPTLPLSGRLAAWGGVAESCRRPVHSRGLFDGMHLANILLESFGFTQ